MFGFAKMSALLMSQDSKPEEVRTVGQQSLSLLQGRDEAELGRLQSVSDFNTLSPLGKQEKIMQLQAAEKGSGSGRSPPRRKLKRFPAKARGPYVQEKVATAARLEADEYLRPVQEEEEALAAMRALERTQIERHSDTNMNLAKAYRNKLEAANEHMMNVIAKQTRHLQGVIKVLDFQQEQQKDPTNQLAFKDYFALKGIMLQREQAARQKLLEEEEGKRLEELCNKTGKTTTAFTHTNMPSSEMPSGAQTHREDDKTETAYERGTEAHTVLELNQQIQDAELATPRQVGRDPIVGDDDFFYEHQGLAASHSPHRVGLQHGGVQAG